MILKGNQRANAADLAIHLMNGFDNETVEIAQVRGTIAADLYGAFAEFEAYAAGTKAKQPLYSLSINPSAPLTRDQYMEAIGMIEQRLGLTNQPRAVVFHIKHGREHCHVVWSRIDTQRLRAIPMSHDHTRLMDLACDLARRYGLTLADGLKAWDEKRRKIEDRLDPTLGEKAQADGTGITPEQRRADITACYERSDTGAAFIAALEEKGYVLARGDRRSFILVCEDGMPLSLSRYVKGHSARQIGLRLFPVTPDQLPSVEQAQDLQRQRAQARAEHDREQARDEIAESAAVRQQTDLTAKQQARRVELAGKAQDLRMRQAAERLSLHAAQKAESESPLFRLRRAVADFIGRTPGLRSVLGPIQKLTGLDPAERQQLERAALDRRHGREMREIDRHERALTRLENRERQALDRRLAQAEQRDRQMAEEAAARAAAEAQRARDDQAAARSRVFDDGELSETFNDLAAGPRTPPSGGDEDGGPDNGHKPDGPAGGRRRRRKRGYGYRRDH